MSEMNSKEDIFARLDDEMPKLSKVGKRVHGVDGESYEIGYENGIQQAKTVLDEYFENKSDEIETMLNYLTEKAKQ